MITRYYPPIPAGPATSARLTAERLAKNGHEVFVATLNYGGNPVFEKLGNLNIFRSHVTSKPYEVDFIPTIISCFKLAKLVNEIIRKYDVDIIHSHETSVGGTAGALANITEKRPSIVKFAGHIAYEYLHTKHLIQDDMLAKGTVEYRHTYADLLRRVENWEFNQYNIVMAPSFYQESLLLRSKVPPKKIRVIYNPIDLMPFKIDRLYAKQKLGYNDTKIILGVGRLIPIKRFDLLIQAFNIAVNRHPNTKLVIVGDGPERQNLENIAKKLGIDKFVIFTGSIGHDQIPLYMAGSDVFVLSSDFESHSQVIIEALASGTPVVSTSVGAIPEYITDKKTGILVESGNLNQLVDAINETLFNENLTAILRKNGFELAQSFDINNIYGQIVEIYQELICGKA